MVPRAFLIPITLIALALVAPGVQAGVTISVTGDDRGPEIMPGESKSVDVEVSFVTNGNIICPTDGPITIDLRVGLADAAGGFAGAIDPAALDFTIPTGAYTDVNGQHESETQSATLTMTIDAEKMAPGHPAHALSVIASYDGSAAAQCQGDIGPGTDSEASHTVTFPIKQLPQEEPATPGGGNGNDGGNDDDTEVLDDSGDSEESPGPGMILIGLSALALVALRRRA